MKIIFKVLLWYYKRKIPARGGAYNKELSRIIDCLQYIIESKEA